MADFNNLLGEVDELERSIPGRDENDDAEGDREPSAVAQEELIGGPDGEDNDEIAEIPSALVDAVRTRRIELSKPDGGDEVFNNDDDIAGEEEGMFGLEGEAEEENGDELLLDADYDKMRRLWIQELNATELLPQDEETLGDLMTLLSEQEQTLEELQDLAKGGGGAEKGNVDPNLASLAASICKMDSDRLSFLLSDILRTRLFKIEQYALHNREMTDRMSKNEQLYLEQYGGLFEKHMKRTVTDHFPKEAWKKLDEPEMIVRPNLNSFVFCRVLDEEGVSLDNNIGLDVEVDSTQDSESEMYQHFKEGSQIFARYAVVRDLILEGKVELMM